MLFRSELPVTKRCEITFMKGSGNAIRRNPILKDMLEISFNRKLSIPSHTEEAAFGACLCALVGGNHISGFNDAGSLIDYNFKE